MVYGGSAYGSSAYGSKTTTAADRIEALKTSYEYTPNEAELIVRDKTVSAQKTSYLYTPSDAEFIVRDKTVFAQKTNYVYTPNVVESSLLLAPRDEIAVLINNEKIESYQGLKVEKRLNEVDTFKFTAFITEEEQRGLISEGQDVIFVENGKLFFKGRMEDVSYDSTFQATCEGEGKETSLLDRKTDRDQYDNLPADEIVDDLVSPTPLEKGVIEEAPLTSLAFDHDNRARAIAGAANAVGYDWRISQDRDDGYDTDYLDFKERIGDEDVVYEFILGETARFVDDETDDGFVANDITMLGRGDGVNQLEARVFAAGEDYVQLIAEVDEDEEDFVPLNGLPPSTSSGDEVILRVGTELIKGDLSVLQSPGGDTDEVRLNIEERGVEDWNGDETLIITHREGISAWLYENITEELGPYTPEQQETAQENSSIANKGVKQLRETDKTVVNLSTLEQVADRELRNRHREVKSIEIRPTNPRIEDEVSLGDQIYIDDGDGQLDGEYRVVGKDITRRTSGEGTILHCANRPHRLVERLSEIERDRDTLNAHMQGATNIDSQSFRDNCEFDSPLQTRLYVPEDAVAVNKIELVFAREPFRGYVRNTDHSHSVSIDDHTHNLPQVIEDVGFDSSTSVDTDTISSGSPGEEHQHGIFADSLNLNGDLILWQDSVETTESGGGTSTTSSSSGSPEYGIFEPNDESSTDIDVLVNDEVVETIENVSVGQEISEGIRLEQYLQEPIAEEWHTIELRPHELTRLNANITKKVYVESQPEN